MPPTMPSSDYGTLFSAHREHLWGLCYRMTGSAADAEDLVQATFERALRTPPADPTRPWRPWLVRVATNLAIDALRRRRTETYAGSWLPAIVETPSGTSSTPTESDLEIRYGVRESASLAFLCALEALDPVQRAVLVLRDVLGYSGPEVADWLETSAGNVRVILHRARRALEPYEAKRQGHLPDAEARHTVALERFMVALQTGDVERIAACLAEDVRSVADSGGSYRSQTRPVEGKESVARLWSGLVTRGGGGRAAAFELRLLNGLPGLMIRFELAHPRDSPRSCLSIDIDAQGQIACIYVVSAPSKLVGLNFP